MKVVATDTTNVGIVELDPSRVNVFPNPTHGLVRIESDQTLRSMTLYGIRGEMVENRPVGSKELELHLEGYSKGLYFLRLVTDEGVVTKRILVE